MKHDHVGARCAPDVLPLAPDAGVVIARIGPWVAALVLDENRVAGRGEDLDFAAQALEMRDPARESRLGSKVLARVGREEGDLEMPRTAGRRARRRAQRAKARGERYVLAEGREIPQPLREGRTRVTIRHFARFGHPVLPLKLYQGLPAQALGRCHGVGLQGEDLMLRAVVQPQGAAGGEPKEVVSPAEQLPELAEVSSGSQVRLSELELELRRRRLSRVARVRRSSDNSDLSRPPFSRSIRSTFWALATRSRVSTVTSTLSVAGLSITLKVSSTSEAREESSLSTNSRRSRAHAERQLIDDVCPRRQPALPEDPST